MKNPFSLFHYEDISQISPSEYDRAVKRIPKAAAERAAWMTLWTFCAFVAIGALIALYYGARPLFWIITGFGGAYLTFWVGTLLWNRRKLDLLYATAAMVRE